MTLCFVIFEKMKTNKLSSWVNIGYLVAYVKDLPYVNVIVKEYDFTEIEKACKEMREILPDVIGLSILQENLEVCIDFANKIKNQIPKLKILGGNVEPSANPDLFLSVYPSIDIVITGEGEETLRNLLFVLHYKHPLSECAGIFYRKNGQVVATKPRALIDDLNTIPFPDRSFGSKKNTLFSIVGSRGCDGRCTFCDSNAIYRHHKKIYVRERSISNIVDEMQTLITYNNCQYIAFVDSTFCNASEYPERRLEELYHELKSRNMWVLFYFNARTEQIKEPFIKQLINLQQVGLNGIQLGLETGNAEDLKLYGKYATVEDNYRAISLFKEYKIPYDCGFINFNPYTTTNKLLENIGFLKSVKHFVTPSFLMTRLSIYSSSPITKKIIADKLYVKNDNLLVTKPYLYNFLFKEIEIIYNSAKLCYDHLYFRDYQWLHNIFAQYKRYGKSDKDYQNNLSKMILLEQFNELYSDICIELFEKIIYSITDGMKDYKAVYIKLKRDIVSGNKKLIEYINRLDSLQNELSMVLFRQNRLILYR